MPLVAASPWVAHVLVRVHIQSHKAEDSACWTKAIAHAKDSEISSGLTKLELVI